MRGTKFNRGKTKFTLFPAHAKEVVNQVFTMGGEKYGAHNWELGIPNSELLDAAERHLWGGHLKGVNFDSESGLWHLAHAATNLIMALDNMILRPELDDRWHPAKMKSKGTK